MYYANFVSNFQPCTLMYNSTYCDAAYVHQEIITIHVYGDHKDWFHPNVANTLISGSSDFSTIILFCTYHINALLSRII